MLSCRLGSNINLRRTADSSGFVVLCKENSNLPEVTLTHGIAVTSY